MNDMERRTAAPEARPSAASWTGHPASDLAEASMRRDVTGEAYRQRPHTPDGIHLAADELAAVVGELRRVCPGADPARVRAIVDGTYRKLAAAAKITDHLIPLTLHRARAVLEAE
ncbi:three-helix bundle dimerization domain-containing protein [Amycolatopsis thermoflava]|uniref:three-helix bundle dimerization domain-containing protein n=1 Tax=Amycolatopsis TaxID=1813 RepID=UPI000416E075|nr:hypothetical protein [Amycolatopsis thermoflava]